MKSASKSKGREAETAHFDHAAFNGDEYPYSGVITMYAVCQSFAQYQDLLSRGIERVKY